MKFILLSVVCLLGAAVAQPAQPKQKRDILPNDPRYGTDYHLNHHHVHDHQHGSNEVEVARALGGYVGSFNVPDNTVHQNNINFQPPTAYGAPNFTPGKPITTSQNTGVVQKTVHEKVDIPAFSQQSSIANFKTAENVETISSGYGAPVQTSAPTFQPVVQQTELNADQVDAQYLPPVAQKTIQETVVETVHKPVDSYGIPIPESAYAPPAIETHQHQDVIEVKSQDTSSSAEVTPVVTVQDTPVHHDVSAQANAGAHVQNGVKSLQTQGQLNHVHHAVQPAVTSHVQKTAKPANQHQNIFQQSVQQFPEFYAGLSSGNFGGSYNGFRNFGSPAATFNTYGAPGIDSSAPSSGYGAPTFGPSAPSPAHGVSSFETSAAAPAYGVPNFGASGASSAYGVPNFGVSGASPSYDSGFGNLGFGYQQNSNGNQYQGSFSSGAVQQDGTIPLVSQGASGSQGPQFPQFPFFPQNQQFPQLPNFGQNVQFPQIPNFGQNQQFTIFENQQFPNVIPNFLTQFPGFGSSQQGNNQGNIKSTQPTVSTKSDSVNVKTVKTQQDQPAGVQVNTHTNTHTNANTFVKQNPSFNANVDSFSGYVY